MVESPQSYWGIAAAEPVQRATSAVSGDSFDSKSCGTAARPQPPLNVDERSGELRSCLSLLPGKLRLLPGLCYLLPRLLSHHPAHHVLRPVQRLARRVHGLVHGGHGLVAVLLRLRVRVAA